MKLKDLRKTLESKGFNEENLDTGYNYTMSTEHVELICYIEPDIEIEFISIYKWDNNDVKGIHNISVDELSRTKEPISAFFKKTIKDMPLFVGHVNIHTKIEEAINETFD